MLLLIDFILVMLILTSLRFITSSRIASCIQAVALQGVLIGALPLIVGEEGITLRACLLSGAAIALKGIVFPWLLLRALRTSTVYREVKPLVSHNTSLAVGAVLLALAIWLGKRLPLPIHTDSPLILPLAMFTLMVGLFVIVSRRNALTQVLGYLAMENGIYTFGVAFAMKEPMLVELGVLLDAFMAVFVMGITIFHISREFEHLDTDRLSVLKD